MKLRVADRGYVVQNGRLVVGGATADLLADPAVQAAYLGQHSPMCGHGIDWEACGDSTRSARRELIMAEAVKLVDVDDVPDVLRLAREVRESGVPLVLRQGGNDRAVVTPVTASKQYPWRTKTPEDIAAFRSAAGGWQDVDTDRLLEDIYADRDAPFRDVDR